MPLRWIEALKIWNAKHNPGKWCVARKGSSEYDQVKAIQQGNAVPAKKEEAKGNESEEKKVLEEIESFLLKAEGESKPTSNKTKEFLKKLNESKAAKEADKAAKKEEVSESKAPPRKFVVRKVAKKTDAVKEEIIDEEDMPKWRKYEKNYEGDRIYHKGKVYEALDETTDEPPSVNFKVVPHVKVVKKTDAAPVDLPDTTSDLGALIHSIAARTVAKIFSDGAAKAAEAAPQVPPLVKRGKAVVVRSAAPKAASEERMKSVAAEGSSELHLTIAREKERVHTLEAELAHAAGPRRALVEEMLKVHKRAQHKAELALKKMGRSQAPSRVRKNE